MTVALAPSSTYGKISCNRSVLAPTLSSPWVSAAPSVWTETGHVACMRWSPHLPPLCRTNRTTIPVHHEEKQGMQKSQPPTNSITMLERLILTCTLVPVEEKWIFFFISSLLAFAWTRWAFVAFWARMKARARVRQRKQGTSLLFAKASGEYTCERDRKSVV